MRVFADLHLHSKYSRGCSKNLDLENLVNFSKLKGLKLLITGDFTHPLWFKEIKEKLKEADGAYKIDEEDVYFLVGGEISSIFSRKNKVYKIHFLVILPNLEIAEKLNRKLSLYGKLESDGRPTFGLDIIDLLKIILDTYDKTIIIPAHVWTPHFSLYGSNSGFNSIYEAFNDFVKYISAVETGLSSDPNMNWRLPELDNISIVSFSDAHSPYTYRIGREATLFELEKISFENLYKALNSPDEKNKILMTVEFFPEEGKYHFDGHRFCKVRFSPEESKKNHYICPVCQRRVTIGVLSRVEELAKRPPDFVDPKRPPFKKTVPLAEILAQIYDADVNSKIVEETYLKIIKSFGPELEILTSNYDKEKMKENFYEVYLALEKIDKGEIILEPGYDGEYGKVIIKLNGEKKEEVSFRKTKTLF